MTRDRSGGRGIQRAGALALLIALAGCGTGADGTVPPSQALAPSAAASSGEATVPARSDTAGSPTASADGGLAADEFQNPVIDRNFADPFVLRDGDRYVAYATGDLTYNIQVSVSDDLVDWTPRTEALPRLPFWQPSSKGLTWAPEVVKTDAGYVMHYTARDVQAGRQCLAVAVAESAEGPFVDESEGPLVCQLDLGGSIDSSPFQDADGQRYLLWKSDGNCCGIPVALFIQPLSDDGLRLEGEPSRIEGVAADNAWERILVEAPTLYLHDGTYFLFYSANDYNSRDYAVGYATSSDVLGPYVEAAENPILATEVPFGSPPGSPAGPGHQSIVLDDQDDPWLVYHAWDSGRIGDQTGGRRALWLDELVFDGDRVTVRGPDAGPQARP